MRAFLFLFLSVFCVLLVSELVSLLVGESDEQSFWTTVALFEGGMEESDDEFEREDEDENDACDQSASYALAISTANADFPTPVVPITATTDLVFFLSRKLCPELKLEFLFSLMVVSFSVSGFKFVVGLIIAYLLSEEDDDHKPRESDEVKNGDLMDR